MPGSARSRFSCLPAAALGAAGLAIGAAASAQTVQTRLVPHEEVPAVSSAASGSFKAFIDRRSGTISYTLSYENLQGDVRQAHIHLGQHSVAGGIMVWLCQTATNPDPTGLSPACPTAGSVGGVIQASSVIGPAAQGVDPLQFDELTRAIRLGVAYVNVHSSKFPAGELRGQLNDRP
ncbi:MAG: CHRD domain-containing protein [Rubrivivax sp.]